MKRSLIRRSRRHTSPSTETSFLKKESKQEHSFFGVTSHENFFQPSAVIQRKCDNCEKDDKKINRLEDKKEDKKINRQAGKKEEEKIHRTKSNAQGQHNETRKTSSYINSLNGKGAPLPQQSQFFFREKFGVDFSNVKIHSDKNASESAEEIHARAYTVGNHIVFKDGEYNTESVVGKKLLAHELVHVLQNDSEKQIMRQVDFAKPTFLSVDPIPVILSKQRSSVGLTVPTLNTASMQLPTKKDIMKMIFDAFNANLGLLFDSKNKKCKVDLSKVHITISANVTLPTDPASSNWSGTYAGNLLDASQKCSSQKTVYIEMTGSPDSKSYYALVQKHEDEHYQDLVALAKKHLGGYYTYLSNLEFSCNDPADCGAKFKAEVGTKDIDMARAFVDEWLAAVAKHDNTKTGTHNTKSVTDARDCKLVTITVS